ncbi:hypothetical protein JNJ66_07440 [Candidatus Saccharibacteria bacterium]|nr:hypothetical protein [Candidatus Saccharibacteria bacterium]
MGINPSSHHGPLECSVFSLINILWVVLLAILVSAAVLRYRNSKNGRKRPKRPYPEPVFKSVLFYLVTISYAGMLIYGLLQWDMAKLLSPVGLLELTTVGGLFILPVVFFFLAFLLSTGVYSMHTVLFKSLVYSFVSVLLVIAGLILCINLLGFEAQRIVTRWEWAYCWAIAASGGLYSYLLRKRQQKEW